VNIKNSEQKEHKNIIKIYDKWRTYIDRKYDIESSNNFEKIDEVDYLHFIIVSIQQDLVSPNSKRGIGGTRIPDTTVQEVIQDLIDDYQTPPDYISLLQQLLTKAKNFQEELSHVTFDKEQPKPSKKRKIKTEQSAITRIYFENVTPWFASNR